MSIGNQYPNALGQAYDSFASVARNTASPLSFGQTNGGALSKCRIRVCEGIQSVNDTLEISAAASAGIPGVAKVEAKVEFVRSLQMTSRTVSIVIHAQHAETLHITNVKLTSPPPPNTDAALSFYRSNGDSYVSSLQLGGEYIAVYSFYSETVEEAESLKGSLALSGIVDGVEFTAELTSKISTAVQNSTVETLFEQTLLGHANLALPTQDQIIPFALNFSRQQADRPVVVAFAVTPYEDLFGDRKPFQEITANRDTLTKPGTGGAAWRTTRYEILNQARWLRDGVYVAYGYRGDKNLETKIGSLENDLGLLNSWLFQARDNPTRKVDVPAIATATLKLPRLNYKTASVGSWGYKPDGDHAFADDFSGVSPWAVRRIRARGNKTIDKLEVTYGLLEIGGWANAAQNVVRGHGGEGGEWGATALELDFGEYITSIAGSTNNRGRVTVTQLQIKTSKGKTWTFPNAPWPSTDLSADVHSFDQGNNLLVGFSGMTSDHLAQLSGTVLHLSPAIWE